MKCWKFTYNVGLHAFAISLLQEVFIPFNHFFVPLILTASSYILCRWGPLFYTRKHFPSLKIKEWKWRDTRLLRTRNRPFMRLNYYNQFFKMLLLVSWNNQKALARRFYLVARYGYRVLNFRVEYLILLMDSFRDVAQQCNQRILRIH